MALADVLTAVRALILDEQLPSGSAADRRSALRVRFEKLSDQEIEDLSAIEPSRLRVYTSLVYAGECGTLNWVFPVSMAAIVKIQQSTGDDRADGDIQFELTRQLHQSLPWRSSSTRELARNFERFVLEDRKELVRNWGGLPDLLDFERTELEVFYAEDSTAQAVDVASMAALSVEELMSRIVTLPAYAGVRTHQFDVRKIVKAWRTDGRLGTDALSSPPCRTLLAYGRAPDVLMPRWVTLTEAGYSALTRATRTEPVQVNELATAYLDALAEDDSGDEKAMFESFFRLLSECFAAGVLLQPAT